MDWIFLIKTVFSFVLILCGTWYLRRDEKKRYAFDTFLLVAMLVSFTLIVAAFIMPEHELTSEKVRITALNKKNANAKESTVYLTGIYVAGKKATIRTTTDASWYWLDNWYVWRAPKDANNPGGLSQSIELELPLGKDRSINFFANKRKGFVKVEYEGTVQVLDCYSPKDKTLTVHLKDTPRSILIKEALLRLSFFILLTTLLSLLLIVTADQIRCKKLKLPDRKYAFAPIEKNYAVEFVRFLLCCVVCIHHFRRYDYHVAGTSFRSGYLGVDVFFVVSGFFLMAHFLSAVNKGLNKPGLETFSYLLGRIKRLFPHHAFSWILRLVMLVFFIHKYTISQALGNGIWEFLLLKASGLGNDISINGVSWYISAMLMAGGLIYFLLCIERAKRGHNRFFLNVVVPLVFLIVMSWIWAYKGNLNYWVQSAWILTGGFWRAFAEMSLGCLVYSLVVNRQPIVQERLVAITATLVEMICLFCCFTRMYYMPNQKDFAIPLLAAVWLFSTFSFNSYLTRILNNPLSAWLGKISWPMYLNQFLVIDSFTTWFSGYDYYTMTLIMLIITLCLSAITNPIVDSLSKWALKVPVVFRKKN